MSDSSEQGSSPGSVAHTDRHAPGGIVVGVDGGPAAAAALRWAARQSRATGMGVEVVHAWQLTGPHIGPIALLRLAASADARARATRWVIDALADSDPSLPWTLGIVEAAPGPALVDRARSAPLLVMGTGEHNGLRRLVVGSVSHYVIAHAVPPVVVVRAPPAPPLEEWWKRPSYMTTQTRSEPTCTSSRTTFRHRAVSAPLYPC